MDSYLSKPVSARQLADAIRLVVPDASPVELQIDLRTVLDRTGGDKELVNELVEAFIPNSAIVMERIRTALLSSDYEALERGAHLYKGSAAVLELSDLVETSAALEQAARARDAEAVKTLVNRIETQTSRAVASLTTIVQEAQCAS
jgi:HPt (histidine-containing phosphotransfer) domain-containing protein